MASSLGVSLSRLLYYGAWLVTLAAALVLGDWYVRNQEMDRLLDAIEASEKVTVAGHDRFEEVVAGRVPVVNPRTGDQTAQLRRALQDASEDAGEDLLVEIDSVREVRILPWHKKLARAKQRYLDHARTWEDRFRDGAKDPSSLFERRSEIGGTFRVAVRNLRKAIPLIPRQNFKSRINQIEKG